MRSLACLVFAALMLFGLGCSDGGTTPRPVDSGTIDSGRPPTDGGGGTCSPSRTNCMGVCVLLETNPAHCGACGNACAADETCGGGMCRVAMTCPAGQDDCGDGCVPLSGDDHCGRCGNACDEGESCMDGSCQPAMCATGQTRCGATCTDTNTDGANCGACDNACASDQMCTAGVCESACPAGQDPCSIMDGMGMRTVCVDLGTDSEHCDACGDTCPAGQSCETGTCKCPTGTTDCGGVCVSFDTDAANCGACGTTCATGQACVAGLCECPSGQTECDGACVNTEVDDTNCGACGTTCTTPAETCVSGVCATACGAGVVDCGGACVDIATDRNHCGACDNMCGAGLSCGAGVCGPSNDDRTNAIAVPLPGDGREALVTGTTTGATRDGATISGCSANGPNVWYSVTIPSRGVLWVDTAAPVYEYDTAIFITDDTGTPVSVTGGTSTADGLCNDDCCDGSGDFTDFRQSCAGGTLPAGTYNISVGGFTASSVGDFTLHVQFLPQTGFLYSTRLDGVGTTTDTLLVGTSEAADMCAGGFSSRSGEDMRWFASCGERLPLVSTCAADGGAFERENSGDLYDPVMYVVSAETGTQVACNDDGPSALNCTGVGGDSAGFGSRISDVMVNRGVHALFIDSRGLGGSGMNYSMRYDVPAIPDVAP